MKRSCDLDIYNALGQLPAVSGFGQMSVVETCKEMQLKSYQVQATVKFWRSKADFSGFALTIWRHGAGHSVAKSTSLNIYLLSLCIRTVRFNQHQHNQHTCFCNYSTQLTQPHFSVLRSLSDLLCVNQLSAPGPGLFELCNLPPHFVNVVSTKRQSATWSCKEQRQPPLYRVAPNFPLADNCHQTLAVCVMHNHNIL